VVLYTILGRPTSHLLVWSLTKCQVRGMRGLDVLIRIITPEFASYAETHCGAMQLSDPLWALNSR
jgi:hypothetical protein